MSVEPHQWTNSSNLGPLINSMYSIIEFYFVLGAPPKHLVDVNKGKSEFIGPTNELWGATLSIDTRDSAAIHQ
jgi:hypothetical protein